MCHLGTAASASSCGVLCPAQVVLQEPGESRGAWQGSGDARRSQSPSGSTWRSSSSASGCISGATFWGVGACRRLPGDHGNKKLLLEVSGEAELFRREINYFKSLENVQRGRAEPEGPGLF